VTSTGSAADFAALRDRVQSRVLSTMDAAIERLDWDASRLASWQRDGLRALLRHAVAHSPFHRDRLASIDVEHVDLGDLARLPVMTKSEMMADFDRVVTDPCLTRAALEDALARTTGDPVPLLGEYTAMSSGGSSGRRGVFVLDVAAQASFFTSLSRSLTRRLRTLGGPPPGGLHIAMVAASSATHATGAVPSWTAGDRLPFRFTPIPVTLPLPEIVERLNAAAAPALYGYPTMLARLAGERRAGRLRITPVAVTATSETLHPELRDEITDAFGVPVVDTFGSTEGLAGASAPGDDVLVFNSDVCIVELVDAGNRPVPPGVASDKVLVTNLANRVQPLIRYELTDRFERVEHGGTDGHLRARVHGRSDDVLHYDGVDIHPFVVRTVMAADARVLDYAVQQRPNGIDVSVVAEHDAALDLDGLRTQLAGALARAGLVAPEVAVCAGDALDRHAETGKARRFVPL
jgi:phenylacetate-coenzyme A ligase PaaK-like adenylate-forming protein